MQTVPVTVPRLTGLAHPAYLLLSVLVQSLLASTSRYFPTAPIVAIQSELAAASLLCLPGSAQTGVAPSHLFIKQLDGDRQEEERKDE